MVATWVQATYFVHTCYLVFYLKTWKKQNFKLPTFLYHFKTNVFFFMGMSSLSLAFKSKLCHMIWTWKNIHIYYPHKGIYLLVFFFRHPNILLLRLLFVYTLPRFHPHGITRLVQRFSFPRSKLLCGNQKVITTNLKLEFKLPHGNL